MKEKKDKLLVHFDTNLVSIYSLNQGSLKMLHQERNIEFEKDLSAEGIFQKLDNVFECIKKYTDTVNNKTVRLYATGIFQKLEQTEVIRLANIVYVYHGLYFNIIQPDLEDFYLETSLAVYEQKNTMLGLVCQEFRNVVVCGSFKHSIKEIEDIITKLKRQNINVLSPTTTKLKPETLGSNFVLFEGQELINERDAWRHQYKHISQFVNADAVIICNPDGIVGKSALFELGYLVAISKRIIFMEEPQNISFYFPYEVGLNF